MTKSNGKGSVANDRYSGRERGVNLEEVVVRDGFKMGCQRGGDRGDSGFLQNTETDGTDWCVDSRGLCI